MQRVSYNTIRLHYQEMKIRVGELTWTIVITYTIFLTATCLSVHICIP